MSKNDWKYCEGNVVLVEKKFEWDDDRYEENWKQCFLIVNDGGTLRKIGAFIRYQTAKELLLGKQVRIPYNAGRVNLDNVKLLEAGQERQQT